MIFTENDVHPWDAYRLMDSFIYQRYLANLIDRSFNSNILSICVQPERKLQLLTKLNS